MDITKLLKPHKIAIVGASEKTGFGGDTCRNVMRYMADGSCYFVNPRRGEVFGRKAYPSISDLPEPIDTVVICTPQSTVEDLLREAAAKGAGGAVVFASGYKEVGTEEGRAAQERLAALCRELDMALMGPNCAGFVNYVDMVYPFAFLSADRDRRGSVGMVSQSGQLCLSLMDSPSMRFSYVISSGNCAVVEMEDYLDFLVDDPDTRVVALYLEGVKNPAKFVSALRKAALKRKPIVVLKAGRSEKGAKQAASHTGSLAGADRVFDALFAKFGVVRVNDLEELLYTAQMFSVLPRLPEKPAFASMNLSGGETGICADMGEAAGIEYPDFAPETLAKLREQLPGYASPANPLDMTASLSYDTELYAGAVRTVMSDPGVGMVLVGYTLLEEIADPAIEYMAPALERVSREPGAKPMAMLPFVGNTRNQKYLDMLEGCGVVMLPPPVYAFRILRYLADFIRYDSADHNLDVAVPERPRGGARCSLGEHEGKLLARRFGLSVPAEEVARSEEEAAAAARRIGFPVVMKIDSPDILHKSDCGCVKVNVRDAAAAGEVYRQIVFNAQKHHPDARINGVLVQQTAQPGTEMIIGVASDPSFGPTVLVGLGGVFVEVFKDTALCLAPVSRAEAMSMAASLKGAKLLRGYRGAPALDMDGFVDAVLAVSDLAVHYKDTILEMDFNPVFLYEKGTCAVDAVVVSSAPLE